MNQNTLKKIIIGGLFLVPFIPFLVSGSLFFPFITTKAFAWRVIVEIILGLWIVLACIAPEYRPKKSPILYAFIAFLFIIGLADFFGVSPIQSFWSNFERMEGFISLLHLGAFFIVSASMFKEREWKAWWNTNLAASAAMVVYCFFQLLGVLAIHQGGARVDGTIGNAAYLAVYMLINIFIALLLFVREKKGSIWRWVYGILIVAQAIVLYYTATRGAILGLVGGLGVVALLSIINKEHPKAKKGGIIFIVACFILLGGFLALRNTAFVQKSEVLSRFASISLTELKSEGRSYIWPMAVEGITERPLLGWGQENFNYVFDEHYSPQMYALEPWFDRAHNIFLDWGVAGGILGLLGYLSLYVFLLLAIWKRDTLLSHLEKSLLTGLIAGYFFNNLFVFDNLTSYILFAALLAYVHSRTAQPLILNTRPVSEGATAICAVVVVIVLVPTLYFVNIKPLIANTTLINALEVVQTSGADQTLAIGYFEKAYNESRLGRPEIVEWIASDASTILGSNISTDEKNNYFAFAKQAVEAQVASVPNDARYQILAGSFFSSTGNLDEALTYLKKAEQLIPGKQQVYFELGQVLLQEKDYNGALAYFKQAYDLAPAYQEAQVIYLIGAIYANNPTVAAQVASAMDPSVLSSDTRISDALLATGNYSELIALLKARLATTPTDPQNYASLAVAYVKAGDSSDAVAVLKNLETVLPQYKTQAEQYITQVQSGQIQ
jgi:O-antigen ligase/tetratricopeptide (TPR) repeat protein